MTQNRKRLLIIVVITVIFLVLAFYRVDLVETRQAFSHINTLYLLLATLTSGAGLVIRALRWHCMIQSPQRVSFRSAFSLGLGSSPGLTQCLPHKS